MASITGVTATASVSVVARQGQVFKGVSGLKLVSFCSQRKNVPSVWLQRSQISCAAKPETVEKVCQIVKQQLALAEGTDVTGASKFSDLGADSLDTVEIVMGLEEAFKISVEEESASSIATVQDAAEMIDKLIDAK